MSSAVERLKKRPAVGSGGRRRSGKGQGWDFHAPKVLYHAAPALSSENGLVVKAGGEHDGGWQS